MTFRPRNWTARTAGPDLGRVLSWVMTSGFHVQTIRALVDNYCYLVVREGSTTAVAVDPSEAAPVAAALSRRGLKLGAILNTHHHHDHVGGNRDLVATWACPVFCSARDFDRVPTATHAVTDAEKFVVDGLEFEVLAIPGHTAGQIAYRIGDALFVGDTVFEMGCGRLFEGTAAQMFASLERLKAVSPQARLYVGHEYTEVNARFALTVEPSNASAIHERLAQVRSEIARQGFAGPPTIATEEIVNPFFRARDLATFSHLRERRDRFN